MLVEVSHMVQRVSPGKWPYWLGGTCGVLGVGGGVVMIVMSVLAMLSFSPHRMLGPGTSRATLAEAGSQSVYHEFRSVYKGKRYRTKHCQRDRVWETLRVSVTDAKTGDEIPVEPASVSSTYRLMNSKYAGKKMFTFSVPAPTEVKVKAYYSDGKRRPAVVLAVGKMKILRFVVLLTAGIFAVVGGFAIALPLILVTLFLRIQSKQKITKLQMEP